MRLHPKVKIPITEEKRAYLKAIRKNSVKLNHVPGTTFKRGGKYLLSFRNTKHNYITEAQGSYKIQKMGTCVVWILYGFKTTLKRENHPFRPEHWVMIVPVLAGPPPIFIIYQDLTMSWCCYNCQGKKPASLEMAPPIQKSLRPPKPLFRYEHLTKVNGKHVNPQPQQQAPQDKTN